MRKYIHRSIEEIEMNAIQPTLQTVSGHIDQFRKITPTLATFRVNGIACKAERLAVAHVEHWSKKSDCVYEFQGAYQQSRFGREFVVIHGRPEALVASSLDRVTLDKEKQIEFYMDLMKDYSPEQLRLKLQFTGNHEYDREAARRLLERALRVKASTRNLSSSLITDRCSGEAQGPTAHNDN
jgi:hypothetical protein